MTRRFALGGVNALELLRPQLMTIHDRLESIAEEVDELVGATRTR
jgi:hypothetical protein